MILLVGVNAAAVSKLREIVVVIIMTQIAAAFIEDCIDGIDVMESGDNHHSYDDVKFRILFRLPSLFEIEG